MNWMIYLTEAAKLAKSWLVCGGSPDKGNGFFNKSKAIIRCPL